jgi:hypothetical protein
VYSDNWNFTRLSFSRILRFPAFIGFFLRSPEKRSIEVLLYSRSLCFLWLQYYVNMHGLTVTAGNSWWHCLCVRVIRGQAWSRRRGGGRERFFEWAFRRTSKSLFGKMVWLSLIWLLLTYSAYMWNFSSVLRCGSFLCLRKICMVFWMFPNGWLCSMRCCANFDVWLFVLKACLCSLNLIWKFLPVWPTYALLHTGHVSLYMPVSVYLSFVFCSSL